MRGRDGVGEGEGWRVESVHLDQGEGDGGEG